MPGRPVSFEARVWDPDYANTIYLEPGKEEGLLRLIVSTDADAQQIDLDIAGVANLRKALQRYERMARG
jgi:hypothetical protein